MNNPFTSPRTKRAANVLGIILLIALVAPFAVYAAPEVVGADESFVVLTASMTPAIAPGDVVIVAERDPAAIAEGDVITFVRGTSDVPVTHRVTDVVDEGGTLAFETRGDANEGPDPGLVPASNLVGAVALTIPYIGYVIQFAGTRAGFVTLVLLPFGLLAVTEIWSIVRGRDESGARPRTSTGPIDEPADGDDAEATASEPVEARPASGPVEAGSASGESAGRQAETAAVSEDAATSRSGGISVDAVGGAAAVLTAFAPYAVYVALQLRTAVAISVAVGTSTLLLGALAAWLPASGVLDRSGSGAESATAEDRSEPSGRAALDGGTAETDGDSSESSGSSGSLEPSETSDPAGSGGESESASPTPSVPSTPPAQPDGAGEGD